MDNNIPTMYLPYNIGYFTNRNIVWLLKFTSWIHILDLLLIDGIPFDNYYTE